MKKQSVTLELSSGKKLVGSLLGAPVKSSGELVFTTAMVGYTEALSDPSYFGQILVFAYPLIGNYGLPSPPKNRDLLERQFESQAVHASGVIISQACYDVFHWTSGTTLDTWLKSKGVPGIVGLDTRYLVTQIRDHGGLFAKILPSDAVGERSLGDFNTVTHEDFFDPNQHPVVTEVSTKERKVYGKGKYKIAVYDFGVKWNILRSLLDKGFEIEVLPWQTDPSDVDCSAWILSNGPGNPNQTFDTKDRIRKLMEQNKPILGICLGHQLLSLAAGAKVVHMSYGHRSHNQPVFVVGKKKAYITSQNHSFKIEEGSLPEDWNVWFRNVNDNSIEGIQHQSLPFKSIQFHPESSGGPRDTAWIFDEFLDGVKKHGNE